MELLIVIVILMWFWASYIAKKNWRNVYIALLVWLIFWIFGVIFYAILWKSKSLEKKEKEEELERLAIIINGKK